MIRTYPITFKKSAYIFGFVFLFIYVASSYLKPQEFAASFDGDFEQLIPEKFGGWEALQEPNQIQVGVYSDKEGNATMNNPYDKMLMRTFQNEKGERVYLAIAWGAKQQQEIKVHRPELCYQSQGFKVNSTSPDEISAFDKPLPLINVMANTSQFYEEVTYFIRIGNKITSSPTQTRLYILKEGLNGRVPDGLLFRVSSRYANPEEKTHQTELNKSFLSDVLNALNSKQKSFVLRQQ